MTRIYPLGSTISDQHRIDWRRRLMKVIPRDVLEKMIDAEKRPHMMDRREVEETLVISWDDDIKDALIILLTGNI